MHALTTDPQTATIIALTILLAIATATIGWLHGTLDQERAEYQALGRVTNAAYDVINSQRRYIDAQKRVIETQDDLLTAYRKQQETLHPTHTHTFII